MQKKRGKAVEILNRGFGLEYFLNRGSEFYTI